MTIAYRLLQVIGQPPSLYVTTFYISLLATSNKKLLEAPGLTPSNKKLLGASGLTTSNKKLAPSLSTSNKSY